MSPGENKEESDYIVHEAQTLFRKNQNLQDEEEINNKIFEAQSRLELGVHYKIPYPRYYNVGPRAVLKTKQRKHFRVPSAYMDSLYPTESETKNGSSSAQ